MTRINNCEVCIIGGGAAGLMAALIAAESGRKVVIIEKNKFCGKKLNITGKGRCNITNNCDITAFMENVTVNPRFLYKALTTFSPTDTISFFENRGVPVKTEQGRRVFPVSDKARDVTDCLEHGCRTAGVRILQGEVKKIVTVDGKVKSVLFRHENEDCLIDCESAILATGGATYPLTGSTGDGYRIAKELGHTITDIKPSLVPLLVKESFCVECMGLSLKNVKVSFYDKNNKELYSETGEMLFTHFGVTGPIILSASAHIKSEFPCRMFIDMKPGLDEETLDRRLVRDFEENKNKNFINSLSALLPQKMIEPIIKLSGIDGLKKVNEITRTERKSFLQLLKGIPLTIKGTRPVSEAIITSGGVSVKEINPSTMESKLVKGLFFAGEIIDVDAYTGGYNLQIAFSTGYVAGQNS
ncbi:MAG: FAD-dependent oxidoreductase [Clostridiales bacterium GWF2_36_10]|nr:MAG: FAD-dependent oxidoreductase [Clostridiales bacterium GWF2_36_10]HAN21906.1 aminoacetone oxidase family FAD-binding enzyme [Clostridiales bacterium]